MPAPRTELRMMAGFVAVPPTAGILVSASCAMLWKAGVDLFPGGIPADVAATAASLGIAAAFAAFFVVIFGALPIVGWVSRRGPLTLRRVLLVSAALANAPFILIVIGAVISRVISGYPSGELSALWHQWTGAARTIGFALLAGVGSGVVFWFVGVRGSELDPAR
jgi:hypothetical protein